MLTAFDKQLLNIVQRQIPFFTRPFRIIATELGVSENVVIERLRYLKNQGYIRRVGAFFDSEQVGHISTLVALQVTPVSAGNGGRGH